MKKQKYSLTASQRKKIRERAEKKKEPETNSFSGNTGEKVSLTEDSAVSRSQRKFNFWLIPLLIAGVLLIAGAIILPFSCNPYRAMSNPVAEIHLSTGEKLVFEIYEDTCNIAATNFIFLAKNKFFDDTIIYDIQNGWVRFGNRQTMTKYKEDDKKFMDKLPGFYHENKLGYRLKADTSDDARRIDEEGMLTFNYDSSSCEFYMSSGKNLQTDIGGNSGYTPTVVGRYIQDSGTLEVLRRIANLPMDENSPSTLYKPPQTTIKITKVRLYNLDSSKWNKFHFEDYMEPKGGESSIRYWMPT